MSTPTITISARVVTTPRVTVNRPLTLNAGGIIPSKLSHLINDIFAVCDENYIHTDNNFTTEYKTILDTIDSTVDEKISSAISELNINNILESIQANSRAIQNLIDNPAIDVESVTELINAALDDIIDGAPEELNTLRELAQELRNDQSGVAQLARDVFDLKQKDLENADILAALTSSSHNHYNLELLQNYTFTNSHVWEAWTQKHTHSNKELLDQVTTLFTPQDRAKLDSIEAHANNTLSAVLYSPMGLTELQKKQARENIGAPWGTFNGDYQDLFTFPEIDTTSENPLEPTENERLFDVINLHKIAKTGRYEDIVGHKTKLSEFDNDSDYATRTELATARTTLENALETAQSELDNSIAETREAVEAYADNLVEGHTSVTNAALQTLRADMTAADSNLHTELNQKDQAQTERLDTLTSTHTNDVNTLNAAIALEKQQREAADAQLTGSISALTDNTTQNLAAHNNSTTAHEYIRGLISNADAEISKIIDGTTEISKALTAKNYDTSTGNIKTTFDAVNAAITNLNNITAALNGGIVYIGLVNVQTNAVTSAMLDQFVIDAGYVGKQKGYTIYDLDRHEWYCDGTNWVDTGVFLNVQASDSQFGVVKGNEYISIISGLMTVLKSDDALKLGGQEPSYYASVAALNTLNSNLTTYINNQISLLDASLKAYADQSEADAKSYADDEIAALTAVVNSADDILEAKIDTDVAQSLQTAKAYTDAETGARIAAVNSALQSANAYTDSEVLDLSESTTSRLLLKVDKVEGKQLSTNDYSTAEKTKLAGIEAGAQVNPTHLPNPYTLEIRRNGTKVGELYDGSSQQVVNINVPTQASQIDAVPLRLNTFDPTLSTETRSGRLNAKMYVDDNGVSKKIALEDIKAMTTKIAVADDNTLVTSDAVGIGDFIISPN